MRHLHSTIATLFLLATYGSTCIFVSSSSSSPSSSPPPCVFQPENQQISCQTKNIGKRSSTLLSSREVILAQIHALQEHLDATTATPLSSPPPTLTPQQWNTYNKTFSDEEQDSLPQDKTLIAIATIVVSAIVIISIGFEKWHEWLDENVPEVLTPVLKSIWGELTVLGFIGLIMFVTTKVGKKSLDHLVCGSGPGWWSENVDICPRNKTTGHWNEEMGCPENPLIELTEQAHMILFGVMVLFLIESIVLIQIGMSRMKIMQKHEQRCISNSLGATMHNQFLASAKYQTLHCMYKRCSHCLKCCPCFFKKYSGYKIYTKYIENTEFLEYQALRRGFIQAYNQKTQQQGNFEHALKGDFDFAQYSVKVLAERLGEIVELTPGNWLCIWFVFIIFLGFDFIDLITGYHNMLLVVLAVIACFGCSIAVHIVHKKVMYIHEHLVHPFHLRDKHRLRMLCSKARNQDISTAVNVHTMAKLWRRKSSVCNDEKGSTGGSNSLAERLLKLKFASNNKETKSSGNGWSNLKSKSISKLNNELLTQAGVIQAQLDQEHLPLYKYKYNGSLRDAPKKVACCGLFCQHKPTRYESMYWLGKHGIPILFGYLRTQLVLIALYLGVFIVVLRESIGAYFFEAKDNYYGIETWGPILVYAVALVPPAFMLVELSTVIPLLVRITSTEEKINGECVNSTLRVMKSRRALRALHNISCFMAHIDIMASRCLQAARESPTFCDLNQEDEQKLMSACNLHNYRPGTVIIEQGKPNDCMYIISEGTAEVLVGGEVKALLVTGKEFGKISMFTGKLCNASIVVHERMVCFTVKKDKVAEILGEKYVDEEEQFVDIAGGERSLTPEHMESKTGTKHGGHKKRRSSLLDQAKWTGARDWVQRGQLIEKNDRITLGLDTNNNGKIDSWLVDVHDEGRMTCIGIDTTGNGETDQYNSDTDMRIFNMLLAAKKDEQNGPLHRLGIDIDGDGQIDAYMVDTNGDGNFDSVGFDTTGDGAVDAYDTTGDGLPDIIKGSMADVMRQKRPPEVTAQQRKVALIDLFHAIDSGHDGSIDSQEMLEFLTAVSFII